MRTFFDEFGTVLLLGFIAIVIAGGLIGTGCYVFPKYEVWQQGLKGQGEMARAEQNRRVSVLEAQAKKDSATLLADAEVERAKGVAKANAIVAESLKGHDEYLRYLWIDKLAEGTNREVIYVPTEASLPILESQRLNIPAEKGQLPNARP